MTSLTSAIFAQFVNSFKELADPDEGVTEARLMPILGDDVNSVTLKLISRFVSNLFFESVEVGDGNYVCIAGVRLPFSTFTFLKELESGSYNLRILANNLAMIKAGDTFPESFVPQSILGELTDGEYENTHRELSQLVEKAVVGLVNSSFDETTEHSLRSSLPGERH